MSRLYLVCFDIADDARLRTVSKTLEDFGTRVQYSIFECHLNEKNYAALQEKLAAAINHEDDHVRFYPICPKDKKGILLDGKNRSSTNHDYHLV